MDECASFIQARDPSIFLAWNRPQINPKIRMDLNSKYSEGSTSSLLSTKLGLNEENNSENLEVYLRIKPSENIEELYKFSENVLTCHVPHGSQVLRNVQAGNKVTKQFSFSKIYGPNVSQTDIFNDCVKCKVLNFINGRNSTIFTYGTSGSGKTFTILGTPDEPGIIPRSLEYLFRTIPPVSEMPKVKPTQSGQVIVLDSTGCAIERKARNKILNVSLTTMDKSVHIHTYKMMQQRLSTEATALLTEKANVAVGVWVSFAEVYNEFVYDLLQADPGRGKQRPKLRLAQDITGKTYVKDLTNISVSSGLEAYEVLQYGMHNLNYAPTSINSHSSRSHCIFTIKLVQLASDSKVQISHFNFCDLAGSERVKSTRNAGERLKESNNINTSLHVLGRCIKTLRESQQKNDSRLIPFRESKLTRLFQQALSGQESIAMIVNINATHEMFDESQHVLNFSAIAKDILIEKEMKPEKTSVNKRFSQYIQNRSTTLPTINESEVSEIEILREQVLALSVQLEHERVLFDEKENDIRKEIVEAFRKQHEQMAESAKQRYEQEKQGLISLHEFRMDNLKKYYEREMATNTKRARTSIIELDSTIDDELNDVKLELEMKTEELNKIQTTLNDYRNRNNSLQVEKSKIEFTLAAHKQEIEVSQKKLREMSEEIKILTNKNQQLEQVIRDAEIELNDMNKENRELEKYLEENVLEVMHLREESLNLQSINAKIFEEKRQLQEKVEQLEIQSFELENKI